MAVTLRGIRCVKGVTFCPFAQRFSPAMLCLPLVYRSCGSAVKGYRQKYKSLYSVFGACACGILPQRALFQRVAQALRSRSAAQNVEQLNSPLSGHLPFVGQWDCAAR